LGLKRVVRNGIGTILAWMLISLGRLKNAKHMAFSQNVILPIAFHNPDKKLFSRTILWLRKNGFVFLSLNQLIDIIIHKTACPQGAVWISLDDGWKDNIEHVIPAVVKLDIPVTIFICTGAVEEGTFWWRKVQICPKAILKESSKVETLKQIPESERQEIIGQIDRACNTFPREAMSIEEVKNIASIPQVTIGTHTVSHPILPNCPDDQIEYELKESKRKLEGWTGKKIIAFAYPNGSFDGREKRILETCGYKFAATTESKFATADTNAYLFPRHVVMDDGSFSENLCHALGVWQTVVKRLKLLAGKTV